MAYNIGLNTSRGSKSNGTARGGSSGGSYGRVVDIVIDAFHPEYDNYGASQAINGVFYREIGTGTSEETASDLKFAYQGNTNFKTLPIKGEVVELISAPSESERDNLPQKRKVYYKSTVALWNHPHHNAYPDTLQFGEGAADFGPDFEEADDVNPLQSFPGDVLIEGRQGQSIRFNGSKHEDNPWIDSSNNKKPITVISNGQKEAGNGLDNIIEDVNEDPSSIYLTSDHIVELTQANEKRDAWDSEPEKADKYKGSQIILNGGRLYFNAKDESILMSATEAVGANAKTINLDGEKYIALDAKKIYLGTDALNREDEPVLKGQTSTDWLDDFISQFETLIKGMATMPPAPPAAIAKMIATANAIQPVLPILKKRLPQLHSKKVFTE